MEVQTLINFGAGTCLAVAGWFCRQIWDAVKELQHDLHQMEVDLSKNYVQRNEFIEAMKHIESLFQRIYDKIDGKVDK